MQRGAEDRNRPPSNGPSLRIILIILFAAILAASALAYLVVNPFFHQHPR